MKGKYYVYKFEDKNGGVLYVGKSKDIKSRIQSHIREKDWIREGVEVFVAETLSQTDMDIYELYYINKLNPAYNISNAYNVKFSNKLDELTFKHYRTISELDVSTRILNDEDNLERIILVESNPDEYKYSIANEYNDTGYILNKHIYTKFIQHFSSLLFIKGFEFQYEDCGHESLKLIFLFDTDKKVYISMDCNYGNLLLMQDYVYRTIIKDTLVEIYDRGMEKDYVPCELYITNHGDATIRIYNEDYHWR